MNEVTRADDVAVPTGAGTPLSALIVEDSPDDAELVVRHLRKNGFEVAHRRVDTAEQMREALRERAWDVVLSDFNVPGFGAAPALALLRASNQDIPFIVVSAVIGEESAVALMKAGAHDFVAKDHLARLAPAVTREVAEAGERRARREADDALRLDGEILRSLREGVYLIRISDATIVHATAQFERMFGYEPGELIGEHVSIVNAPGETSPEAVAAEIIGALARQGFWQGEVRNVRKDGTIFWCAATVTRYDSTRFGPIWVAAHEDITERKKAAEKIARQLDELRRWHALMLDREDRNMALKREVNDLLRRLGEPIRYPSQEV